MNGGREERKPHLCLAKGIIRFKFIIKIQCTYWNVPAKSPLQKRKITIKYTQTSLWSGVQISKENYKKNHYIGVDIFTGH